MSNEMPTNPTDDGQNRKKAESSLAKSEEIFRQLVDAVSDYAIFALSPEGIVQTWNAGGQRLKGYSSQEMIGQHFSCFYTPEDLERKHPEFELSEAIKHGSYQEEGWRVRKDGTRFWASVVITAIRGEKGEVKGFGKVTRDLTAKRLSEEALRQSEERYRLLIDSVSDYAIIMLDPQGRVAGWNEGAKRIKGYEAKEILGSYISRFYRDEDVAIGRPERELQVATESGRYEEEGIRVRKDGTQFWANVVLTPIRDAEGILRGFAKVTRDITDKREASEKLEQKVLERTAELAKEKERAEQAVKSRDDFLAIASHELRTPLTSLKLKSQMMARGLKGAVLETDEGKKYQKFTQDIEKQIDRIVRLVEDMLDLTRASHGNLGLELAKIDLNEVASATVQRLMPNFKESGTPIEFIGGEQALMSGDMLRVEQIISNLLTNALRYAPKSLVRVQVTTEKSLVRVSVKDEGPGIDPENHHQIFNRYARLSSSISISGLGIGLYLTKSLVEAQGGKIWVESELGNGARFVVEFPRLESFSN